MSLAYTYRSHGCHFPGDYRPSLHRNRSTTTTSTTGPSTTSINGCYYNPNENPIRNYKNSRDLSRNFSEHNDMSCGKTEMSSLKKRKISASDLESSGRPHQQPYTYESGPSVYNNHSLHPSAIRPDSNAYMPTNNKRDRSKFEDADATFMSRDEIERCSPSRRDGINVLHETHLRYSYCAFLQDLGVWLELPQTTIGTAMVLCHRFFFRQSHACHDRFVIATAALFLAAKSEETPRPLNNVLRTASQIFHKHDVAFLSCVLPADWFERYKDRVLEAETQILTTLDFELDVQHPYAALTSMLHKLGFSQSVLVNIALSIVSEGLRSSLWLQFKPHQIAAGAAYLAAKFLNVDLTSDNNVWQEFQTPPFIIQDVAQQLMELF